MSLRERAIITEVLKLYKNLPCLWNPLNGSYFNKNIRHESYEKLLKIYQRLDPDCTITVLKKKIENFRSVYRRERKKVEHSVVNGTNPNIVHKPNLWYYDLLSFLNENMVDGKSSDDEERAEIRDPPKKKKRLPEETENVVKNEVTEEPKEREIYGAKWNEPSYETTYGLTVAKQLKELDEHVRYEAERIISDVIYRARTGTLPKYSPQTVDTFFIPPSAPSWYDVPTVGTVPQQPLDCFVVRVSNTSDPNIKPEYDIDKES